MHEHADREQDEDNEAELMPSMRRRVRRIAAERGVEKVLRHRVFSANFSKSGVSLSIGHRGIWYTVGPHGRRATLGLPGTGLYWTELL